MAASLLPSRFPAIQTIACNDRTTPLSSTHGFRLTGFRLTGCRLAGSCTVGRPGDLGRLPRERTAHRVRRGAGEAPRPRTDHAARRRRRRRVELRRRPAQAQLRRSKPPPGARRHDKKLSGLRFDEILPGNYDGTAHVHDMAKRRRRRLGRLSEQRDLHVHRARPRARARVHALVQRLGARRVPGRGARSHRRRCRCCRSTTASTCASPSSTAASTRARGPGSSPASRCGPTTIRTTTRSTRARPKPACRSRSTARSAASRRKPTTTSWSSRRSRPRAPSYRFFAAVRPFTYMVMGGVFDRHPDAARSSPPR